jgi:hypothetical protein
MWASFVYFLVGLYFFGWASALYDYIYESVVLVAFICCLFLFQGPREYGDWGFFWWAIFLGWAYFCFWSVVIFYLCPVPFEKMVALTIECHLL